MEYGANGSVLHATSNHLDVLVVLQDYWLHVTSRPLHNLVDLSHCLVHHINWSQIYLSDDNDHRNAETESDSNVLSSHALNSHVSSNDYHGVVGVETTQAEHSGLQVFLVATEIGHLDDLFGDACYLRPDGLLLSFDYVSLSGDYLFAGSVETYDFVSD